MVATFTLQSVVNLEPKGRGEAIADYSTGFICSSPSQNVAATVPHCFDRAEVSGVASAADYFKGYSSGWISDSNHFTDRVKNSLHPKFKVAIADVVDRSSLVVSLHFPNIAAVLSNFAGNRLIDRGRLILQRLLQLINLPF